MIVAWTGHRPDLFNDPVVAEKAVTTLARDVVGREAAVRFLLGGQRGVDTWAAGAAIVLDVPFTLILPFEPAEFARDWSADDRRALARTLTRASDVRLVGGDRNAAFTERNRLLVAEADLLVAVWTGVTGGGTAETMAFATSNRTPVREVLLTPSSRADLASGRGV
ncbi:MAG: DUF1273 domain-containing protein [Chloroflexota bacterium]|nr:DUF1273 domain-containing protein [Chloroflexota bacterium]